MPHLEIWSHTSRKVLEVAADSLEVGGHPVALGQSQGRLRRLSLTISCQTRWLLPLKGCCSLCNAVLGPLSLLTYGNLYFRPSFAGWEISFNYLVISLGNRTKSNLFHLCYNLTLLPPVNLPLLIQTVGHQEDCLCPLGRCSKIQEFDNNQYLFECPAFIYSWEKRNNKIDNVKLITTSVTKRTWRPSNNIPLHPPPCPFSCLPG